MENCSTPDALTNALSMKIAIISSGFLPVVDGVTIALYQRSRILSQLNHQVLILCPDYGAIASTYPNWREYQGEVFLGVRVVNLPSESFMGVKFERNLSGKANRRLEQELEAFDPDLVHVDEPDRLFLGMLKAPGVEYARRKGIPCVGFYHTNFIDYIEDFLPLPGFLIRGLQWFSMLFIRPVFHAYDVILVSSPVAEQRLRSLGVRNVLGDRYLGVDVKAFQTPSRRADFFQTEYGISELQDKVKLVFLGRLTPDKGWQFTLRALANWVQQPENASLVGQIALIVAGDGELCTEIKAKLQATNLPVHLLGRIAPEAVPALLVNSDIHITASEKETLGLTVLEAFAAGIPVIAPDAGGVMTHLENGENGLLFEPQNVASFGKALSTLVADAEKRQRMGENGREAIAPYDWDKVVANLVNTWKTRIFL